LENLIKDGWRDYKWIIVGYGYLKPFKKKKKDTMKSLGPMTSWANGFKLPKKKTLVTNHMQGITLDLLENFLWLFRSLKSGFLGV